MLENLKDKTIRSERTPWQYVPRSYRKGYLHRDFFVGGNWYRHFASGADEIGLIRYGALAGTLDDYLKEKDCD